MALFCLIVFMLFFGFVIYIPMAKYGFLDLSPDDLARINLYLTYNDEELKKVSFYDRMFVKYLKWRFDIQPSNEEDPALKETQSDDNLEEQ